MKRIIKLFRFIGLRMWHHDVWCKHHYRKLSKSTDAQTRAYHHGKYGYHMSKWHQLNGGMFK